MLFHIRNYHFLVRGARLMVTAHSYITRENVTLRGMLKLPSENTNRKYPPRKWCSNPDISIIGSRVEENSAAYAFPKNPLPHASIIFR